MNMLSYKEIKQLQKSKKARDEQGLFVTEGRKLFEEAPADRIAQVLISEEFEAKYPEILGRIPDGVPVSGGISPGRFAEIADTRTPQGILTVVRKTEFKDPPAADPANPLYIILENVQDPGNVGTIIRTAEAAGVTAVYLTADSADVYSPKTIRSTMGSIYRVPHFYIARADEIIYNMKMRGIRVFAAHLKGAKAYTECDYAGRAALVIGNEGNGIKDETAAACDELMRIPMRGKVESLNAAMAAGILMYEAARQRG